MSSSNYGPAVGGLFSIAGSIMESDDKAAAYETQAKELERNATANRQVGAYNVMRQQIMAGKKFGAINAAYGASNIAQDSGSVLAVIGDSHINSEFDRLSIIHGAEMRSALMEERARYDRSAANRVTEMGYWDAFGAAFGAAGKSEKFGITDNTDPKSFGSESTSSGLSQPVLGSSAMESGQPAWSVTPGQDWFFGKRED